MPRESFDAAENLPKEAPCQTPFVYPGITQESVHWARAHAPGRPPGGSLAGDPTLFASQSEVEAQCRVVDPVLKNPPPVHVYEPGTWGPPEADGLMADRGGWRIPSLPPRLTRRAA